MSPWRDSPVEENLAKFEKMRTGQVIQIVRSVIHDPTYFVVALFNEDCEPGRGRDPLVLMCFRKLVARQYEEGEAFLRMKGVLTSDNPAMWDTVFYRIKYSEHPHSGRCGPSMPL